MGQRRIRGKTRDRKARRAESESGVSESWILVLPSAILIDIFFRLPINALMKCKCVSRVWRGLISDPNFSVNYVNRSPFVPLFNPTGYRTADFYLYEFNHNGEFYKTLFESKIPRRYSSFSVFLAGSSNGLFCLELCKPGVEVVLVCNPLTGEFVALPERETNPERYVRYKLGFCPSTHVFKVMRLAYKNLYKKGQGEIFTVGVDHEWRTLADASTPECSPEHGVDVNGAYYSILSDSGSSIISSFNFGEEKIGKVSNPPGLELEPDTTELASFDGRLCLVDCSVRSRLTIWTLNECSVADSWTKVVISHSCFPKCLVFSPDAHVTPSYYETGPIAKFRNGDVLFSCPKRMYIFSYDVRKKKLSKVKTGLDAPIYAYAPRFFHSGILEREDFEC